MGSKQYYELHEAEAANYSILLESDEGVFTPYGMQFTGSDNAMAVCCQRAETSHFMVAVIHTV